MTVPADHSARSDDAAAYVLGALEGHEAAEFSAHVKSCPLCAAEVERLSAAAAVLPLAAPQLTAPAQLKRRVLTDATRERRARRQAGGYRPRRLRMRFELIGAGGLAAGLAIGALLLAPGGPGTSVIRAKVAGTSAWHSTLRPVAWVDRSGNDAELVVDDLPEAPAGKVYELWIERAGKPHPTDALFEPTSGGHAEAGVPGGVRGATAILVTAEPRGGSSVPTMSPLIDASLQD